MPRWGRKNDEIESISWRFVYLRVEEEWNGMAIDHFVIPLSLPLPLSLSLSISCFFSEKIAKWILIISFVLTFFFPFLFNQQVPEGMRFFFVPYSSFYSLNKRRKEEKFYKRKKIEGNPYDLLINVFLFFPFLQWNSWLSSHSLFLPMCLSVVSYCPSYWLKRNPSQKKGRKKRRNKMSTEQWMEVMKRGGKEKAVRKKKKKERERDVSFTHLVQRNWSWHQMVGSDCHTFLQWYHPRFVFLLL